MQLDKHVKSQSTLKHSASRKSAACISGRISGRISEAVKSDAGTAVGSSPNHTRVDDMKENMPESGQFGDIDIMQQDGIGEFKKKESNKEQKHKT